MTLTVTVTATVTQDGRGPQPHVDDDEQRRPFCVSAAVTVTAYVTDGRPARAHGRRPCQ